MLWFKQPELAPLDLNAIVDGIGQSLPVHKVRRDLPNRNLTRAAYDVLRALPEPVRKKLGENARRAPYCVHAATAVADSPTYQVECYDWRSKHHAVSPMLTREQKQQAVALYGPQEVRQWRDWIAAEYRARYYAFGTRGLYLRRYFLAECVKYRRVLDSEPQAPLHWLDITALMIRARALVPLYFHRSQGRDYPSFTFSGGGMRAERSYDGH